LKKVSTNPQCSPQSLQRAVTLGRLFPAAVRVIERRIPGDPADLLPSEAHYVVRAHIKRVQEFAAGRACARAALAEFGVRDFALRAADDRQPVWPDGFVGSITHTTGLCAAAVAARSQILAIGLDCEIVGAPTPELWPTICRGEELAWVATLPPEERSAAVTLLFSAKEAFYKCQYPLVTEWLDFHDLRIEAPTWGEASGIIAFHAMRGIRFGRYAALPITGRYVFHDQFVSVGVTLPADQEPLSNRATDSSC
jgi:4'-phosphopantetheinyl transferase EntD